MSKYELYTVQLITTCSNCYILVDTPSRAAAVIDPGCNPDKIMEAIKDANADVKLIIDTHGHWDHIGANVPIQQQTGAKILIHKLDEPMLTDPELNLRKLFFGKGDGGKADRLLEEGDIIELGDLRLQVIHTPGHTEGGICLLCEDLLFTGDTLFRLSVGRSDLPGGDKTALLASLANKLKPLDDSLKVLPGHNSASTLGYEKEHNPFFRQ